MILKNINTAFAQLEQQGMTIRTGMPTESITEQELELTSHGEIAFDFNVPGTDVIVQIIFNVAPKIGGINFIDVIAYGVHGPADIEKHIEQIRKAAFGMKPKVEHSLLNNGLSISFKYDELI